MGEQKEPTDQSWREAERSRSHRTQSGVQQRRKVKYRTLLFYDCSDLGQDVPLLQAAKLEGLDREHLSLV